MLLRMSALLIAVVVGTANAMTLEVGAVHWHVRSGATSARYLPDYSLEKDWRSVSYYAKISAQESVNVGDFRLTATAAGEGSQTARGKITRLDVDVAHAPSGLGARVGVLPYRISWCDTKWIADPDPFCRFHGLNEVSSGAAGAQAYGSRSVGRFSLDAMVGVYRPMVDGQDNKLGPYVKAGPNVLHEKQGIAVDVLDRPTGAHLRVAYLSTLQNQDGSYQRRMDYDTQYVGLEAPVGPARLKYTRVTYKGSQNNPANLFNFAAFAETLQAEYRNGNHSLSVGTSVSGNTTRYANRTLPQVLRVRSDSVAYNYQFGPRRLTLQWTDSKDHYTTVNGVVTYRKGDALGVRLSQTF